MNSHKMIQLACQFILVYVLIGSAIIGAWLAGAEPTAWTWVLGAQFSALLVLGVNLFGSKK